MAYLILAILFVMTGPAAAQDRLVSGEVLRIDAPVEGDLAAAGREVALGAPVSGYALVAGRHVQVSESVGDDLWAAGATVALEAPVGDNAMLAGREVLLGNGAQVQGDVRVAAGSVSVAPGAMVRGDLIVHAASPPEISPGAQVLGQVRYDRGEEGGGGALGWLAMWLYWFLALMVVGLVALWLMPAWAGRVARAMRERPLASLLAGGATLILTPIVAVLLAATVIGIPLAVVLLALYAAAIVLAGALVSYRLGSWMLSPERSRPWPRLALGALVVAFAVSLPWIGWAAQIVVLFLGLGALVLERWRAGRQPVATPL